MTKMGMKCIILLRTYRNGQSHGCCLVAFDFSKKEARKDSYLLPSRRGLLSVKELLQLSEDFCSWTFENWICDWLDWIGVLPQNAWKDWVGEVLKFGLHNLSLEWMGILST
jgi:hypothetical protein